MSAAASNLAAPASDYEQRIEAGLASPCQLVGEGDTKFGSWQMDHRQLNLATLIEKLASQRIDKSADRCLGGALNLQCR
jgi:hypothetical protein